MHGNRKTPFAILKQPPPKVDETEVFNHEFQNGFGRGVWGEVSPLMSKHNVQIYANGKGWWNARLSIIFSRFHFASRDNLGEKILLFWDDFSGYWTRPVQEYAASIYVVLMKIPPGYTSSCHPADIAWMKPFRATVSLGEHLQHQLRSHQESDTQVEFKLVAPSRATLMAWLTNAWERLPTATLQSGFRKLAIPTDKRDFPPIDSVQYEADISTLVEKLEVLNLAEDVGEDFALYMLLSNSTRFALPFSAILFIFQTATLTNPASSAQATQNDVE
ncbi:LOW QUALITY PROTEIN: Hypothetical protein PHPALM_9503 [Phytophthora palmivora]|uniref:DDE-1 domain-containing protein n=1 Tax=Phytophthora palmivora TaxID=4796 RepID=A0A2P4Y740_9STRA|nr:LOW QUALITY PROTEIN: Hypothetical protein PHPALM_9503 [Phytophthora palmivora]